MSSSQVMHNANAINARYKTYPTDVCTPVTGGNIVTQELEDLEDMVYDAGRKREMEVHSPDLAVAFANGYAKGMENDTEEETTNETANETADETADETDVMEDLLKVSVTKPLLKVHEGQMNYIVYSSNGNLQDSTIYGTQINILQSLSAQGESGSSVGADGSSRSRSSSSSHSSCNSSSNSGSIPLPASEYETVSIRVNKAIKEDYKKRKRFQDKGGYYELDDEVCGGDAGVHHSLDGDGAAHEEYALIKAVAFTCGRVMKNKSCVASGGSPRGSRTPLKKHISWNINGCSY